MKMLKLRVVYMGSRTDHRDALAICLDSRGPTRAYSVARSGNFQRNYGAKRIRTGRSFVS